MINRAETIAPTRKTDWVTLIFIVSYHLLLFILLPVYLLSQTPGWALLIGTFVLVSASGLSITAGYHRLFSHHTYRASKPVEWILIFFGTMTAEGSVLRWAYDHRLHHRYVDGEGDPYGTHRGFWHSHLLWLFKKRDPIEPRLVKDLMADPVIAFQHRFYPWLMAAVNVLLVLILWAISGDLFGAIVLGFLLRMFLAHHTTWFINSLAHMWGSKPYSSEHSAVNNFILAFLTFGEGYHNFHHTFAGDYRNGIRWYQFDPTKALIWLLSKLGLASELQRSDPLMIRKRLVQEDRRLLIEHLQQIQHIDTSPLVGTVEKLAERLSDTIASAKATVDRYRSLDRKSHREQIQEMRERFRSLQRELNRDFKTWKRLCRLVLEMEPQPIPA